VRAALAALFALVLAAPAGAEAIRDFGVEIFLDADGSFRVAERIVYDFGNERRHGIYRDVPVRYERSLGGYHIALELEAVTDEAGGDLPYKLSRKGNHLRIRVGDPHRKITGQHEYRISYRVRRATLFFEDHDELYWNVTGTGWPAPIERAAADVYLPPGLSASEVRLGCFTGRHGSRETECGAERRVEAVRFMALRPLSKGEGLTVVVGLPKGIVREPMLWERILARFGDYGGFWLLLPFVSLVGMHQMWRTHGRDPGGPDSIPVRYAPPDGLTPAEVGTLADEKADLADITATILDLAVRGYLSIEEIEGASFLFFSSRDYRLKRERPADGALKKHERRVTSGLFEKGGEVLVSSLKNKFHKHLPGIKKALYEQLSGPRRYFPTSPESVRTAWTIGGVVVAALCVPAFFLGEGSLAAALALGSTGLIVLAYSRVMPRRTRKGRRTYDEVLGFEEFVRRVDADRLQRLDARTSENFEKILPYAIVLGVGDEWAEAFAGIYTEPPDWYRSSTYGRGFHPRHFVSDVGQSLNTIGQTLSSTPSGSGSSGFGGGGSSGGGFGGGGGGSW
jgi:uncharacterized membrane protein YgcG